MVGLHMFLGGLVSFWVFGWFLAGLSGFWLVWLDSYFKNNDLIKHLKHINQK